MTLRADIIGKTVTAHVTRIEHYGLYLSHDDAEIIVLIPDVANHPIRDLTNEFRLGDSVAVQVLRYIEEYKQYKGTMTGREA